MSSEKSPMSDSVNSVVHTPGPWVWEAQDTSMSKNKYEKEAKQARKANRRLKMCESKVAFETEEQAFQKNQRTYKCPHCGKWHRSGAFTTLVNTLQNRSR